MVEDPHSEIRTNIFSYMSNFPFFFPQVQIGGDSYLHLRVFQALMHTGEIELNNVQVDMGKEDPIVFF